MPIDPQIALQTKLPELPSPLQTLGSLAQIQDRRQLNDERRAIVEQKQRALDDDAAVRGALQSSASPDDAVMSLYKQGRATAAGNLSKSLLESRKAQAETVNQLVDSHKKQIDLAGQIFGAATDQNTWDSAYAQASKFVEPSLMQSIPKEFSEDTKKRVVTQGRSLSEQMTAQQNAIKNDHDAQELKLAQVASADAHRENVLKAEGSQRTSVSQLLSTAQNQQQVDRFQLEYLNRGYPPALLAEFGNQWTPDFQAHALKIGMTPAEQSNAAHQKVDENQGAQHIALEKKRVDIEQQRADQEAGGKGRPLTPNERAQVERWKADQYRNLEKQIHPVDATTGQSLGLNPAFDDAEHQRVTDAIGKEKDPAKAADLRTKLADMDSTRAQIGASKLAIENAYRAQLGQPSLEQEETTLSADPAKSKELRQLRNKYRLVSGQDAPLARAEKLMKALKAESDPAKAAALRQQLADIRSRYGNGGAPDQPQSPQEP